MIYFLEFQLFFKDVLWLFHSDIAAIEDKINVLIANHVQ